MDAGINYDINIGGDGKVGINNFILSVNALIAQLGKFDTNVQQVFTEVRNEVEKTKSAVNKISFQSIGQSLEGIGRSVVELGKPMMDFDQQMADLHAITGIAGSELDNLGLSAREVGKSSGLGASQAAEAYKLLASNIDIASIGGVEGLKAIQKETITLAQAAGVDLPTAADTMAAAINQFGLKGSDASKVINVLAAGAKYGAAEIPHLADSFKKVGSVAGAFGVSIEETTGALEVLSQSGQKSELAGQGLGAVITRMKTMLGIDFSKMSLSEALVQLKPKLTDANWLVEKFGQDNLDIISVLLKNADAVGEMTDKVTGTSVAYEQAEIRTATYAEALKRAKAKIEDFKISVFESGGGLVIFSDLMGESLMTLGQVAPAIMLIKDAIIAWKTSETALNFTLFGTQIALDGLGIGLIIAGVVALAAGVKYCWDNFESFRGAIVGFGKTIWDALIGPLKVLGGIMMGIFTGDWSMLKSGIKQSIDAVTGHSFGEGFKEGTENFKTEKAAENKKKAQAELDGMSDAEKAKLKQGAADMVGEQAEMDGLKKGAGQKQVTPLIDLRSKKEIKADEKAAKKGGDGLIHGSAPGTTSGKAMLGNIKFDSVIKTVNIYITKESENLSQKIKTEVARAAMAGIEDVFNPKLFQE